MTNHDRLKALAVVAALSPDDLEGLRARLLHMVLEIELQIERKRPGSMMDRLLGNTKDTPTNIGETP